MCPRTSPWLLLLLVLVLLAGCAPRFQPGEVSGLALQPGNYLTGFARGADFTPQGHTFRVAAFPLEQVSGIEPEVAGQLFQEELEAAVADNGLNVGKAQPDCTVSGAVHQLSLRSPFIRFLTGKSHADLTVSGAISQGDTVVFAFQDRVSFTVLVSPRQPPLEPSLLARRAFRQFAHNLLNELLLPPSPPPQPPVTEISAPPDDQGVTADDG